jgi:RluA family pseudouridine synthase
LLKRVATHIVPDDTSPTRLTDYGKDISVQVPSRKGFKKAILKGYILVNGEKGSTGDWVTPGDQIELFLPQDFKPVFKHLLNVVYEDQHMAVVVKPAGIVTNGNSFQTVENALPFNLNPSTLTDALLWPEVAHRLDYGTSGLLLVAKTMQANIVLKRQFEERHIQKTYRAIVVGEFPNRSGLIDQPIDQKDATTRYELIQTTPSTKYTQFNLLQLYPATGRKHQIRKHLASIGFPILGDRDYGSPKLWDMRRGLYLQAAAITFTHPATLDKTQFEIDLPGKFKKLMRITTLEK